MKVLVTCPHMDVGGAQKFALQIVTGLVERGDEVALAAPAGRYDAELETVPHQRFLLPDPVRSPGRVVQVLLSIRRAIATFAPDAVHAQNVLHAGLAGVAARTVPGCSAPVLATFHGVAPQEYRAAARLFRAADAVACVSDDLLEGLVAHGFPALRAYVVRNAIDVPVPLSAQRSSAIDAELGLGAGPVVAIVGRLAPQKAHDRFLRAAALVAGQLPATRFLVVGDGPRRAELQGLAAELGIADRVVFTLTRDDARDLIARSDLLVFSSDWEGLSIAALEAMASGTPVVSTESHGMRSLLGSGAGEVVRGDAEELGRSIAALLRDDRRRAAMGEVGRRLVAEEYSLPVMVQAYADLFEELRARRDAGARRGPGVRRADPVSTAHERDAGGRGAQ